MVYNFISFPSQNMFYFFFKYFFCLQQKIEMLLCRENEKFWIFMSLAIIEEFLTMSLWVAVCYLSLSSLWCLWFRTYLSVSLYELLSAEIE